MKGVPPRSIALVALFVAAALAASPSDAFAQQTATTIVNRTYRTKADLERGMEQGWAAVAQQCGTVDEACAAAVNAEVAAECAADAHLFSKHTKDRKGLSFALILASAAFTSAGATPKIGRSTSVPKILGTLGGTIALGAVASTVNSSVASDQAGLAAINTTLTAWLKFIRTGKPNLSAKPTPAQIYQAARTYIALCAVPAMASSANSAQPASH